MPLKATDNPVTEKRGAGGGGALKSRNLESRKQKWKRQSRGILTTKYSKYTNGKTGTLNHGWRGWRGWDGGADMPDFSTEANEGNEVKRKRTGDLLRQKSTKERRGILTAKYLKYTNGKTGILNHGWRGWRGWDGKFHREFV
jgi:hypothetical protein